MTNKLPVNYGFDKSNNNESEEKIEKIIGMIEQKLQDMINYAEDYDKYFDELIAKLESYPEQLADEVEKQEEKRIEEAEEYMKLIEELI